MRARPAEKTRRPLFEASLFLLLCVFVLASTIAAVGGIHTAATGLPVLLSLAVSVLIAALWLVAAVTLVVSHVTSSLLWWAIKRTRKCNSRASDFQCTSKNRERPSR